jgi:hypothetical protein
MDPLCGLFTAEGIFLEANSFIPTGELNFF